jgi:hypothetical protein
MTGSFLQGPRCAPAASRPQDMAVRSRATRTICCIVVRYSARISCPAAVIS